MTLRMSCSTLLVSLRSISYSRLHRRAIFASQVLRAQMYAKKLTSFPRLKAGHTSLNKIVRKTCSPRTRANKTCQDKKHVKEEIHMGYGPILEK